MTAQEFKTEVLSSGSAPKNFEQIYDRFTQYQEAAIKTLKEVHRLCEENGIRYQLAYGSLIGAVRDGGQIPWDYDVDIVIPYEDKAKMVEALKKDLGQDFYAWCPEINPKCSHTLMRIVPAGYDSDAIHVDVFYIIGVPDDPILRKEFTAPIGRLYHTRAVKMGNAVHDSCGNFKRLIGLLLEKLRYIQYDRSQAEEEYDRRCSQYSLAESTYCVSAYSLSEKFVFKTEHLWDTELLELKMGTFRISKYYDEILKTIYGDYRTIPPLKDRVSELLNSYKRIEYLCRTKKNG